MQIAADMRGKIIISKGELGAPVVSFRADIFLKEHNQLFTCNRKPRQMLQYLYERAHQDKGLVKFTHRRLFAEGPPDFIQQLIIG